MRLLHTADWHVGKTLRGRSRASEHREVLREIAGIAAQRAVEVVLVAGDLFDTAAPSPEAEEIVYRALLDLAATGARVVVIAGNHDNHRRLAAVRPLLELTAVTTLAEVAPPEAGGVVEIEVRSGETARIALLPFLSQRGIVRADALMHGEAADHAAQYAARTQRIVHALCAGARADAVNVLVAHVMVHGGACGGGERSAHTVFDYSVPAQAFGADLHYVALGHLHRPQRIEGACPIWYCGSPLQLDFGEIDDEKSVNLVEAEPGRPARVESVPLRSGRKLHRVRSGLAELEARAEALRASGAWLSVELDHPSEPGLGDRVREMLPDAVDVRIVHEARERASETRAPRLGRSPRELFDEYLAEREPPSPELSALFDELLGEVQGVPAAEEA